MNPSRRKFLGRATGAIGAVGAGFGLYAFGVEPHMRRNIARYVITDPRWGNRKPLKIGILADIHLCRPWMPPTRLRKFVDNTNALGADLICLLGDYAPGFSRTVKWSVPLSRFTAEISRLDAPLGVHAILGNHDWWVDGPAYQRAIQDAGIALYTNQNRCLSWQARDGSVDPFYLVGTDSILAERVPGNGGYKDRSDVEAAYRNIPADAVAIHLMHEPDLFTTLPPAAVISLAGHTHGGQVRLPIMGRGLVPSEYRKKYAYGHIYEFDRHLVISAGIGTSILPVRFGVPPEVTLVTVKGTTG